MDQLYLKSLTPSEYQVHLFEQWKSLNLDVDLQSFVQNDLERLRDEHHLTREDVTRALSDLKWATEQTLIRQELKLKEIAQLASLTEAFLTRERDRLFPEPMVRTRTAQEAP